MLRNTFQSVESQFYAFKKRTEKQFEENSSCVHKMSVYG